MGASTSELQILLVGDSASGKHCYINMLVHHQFPTDTHTNKDVDIIKSKIKIDEDSEIEIKIINVSGSQRGKTDIKKYYNNIDGIIIMFDVSRAETYDNIIGWKDDIRSVNSRRTLPCIIIANKCDLEKDDGIEYSIEVMNNYIEVNGFSSFFLTSNKNNINIQEPMQSLINEILQRRRTLIPPARPPSSPVSPSSSPARPPSPPISPSSPPARPPSPPISPLSPPARPPSPPISPLSPPARPRASTSSDRPREYKFKILVIGEPGTGKTAFLHRYVNNKFLGSYRSTIGADLLIKRIQFSPHINITLHFWDIAGQERFGEMAHVYYKDAAGCLIAFDVSESSSLFNGVAKWKHEFDKKVNYDENNSIPCLLIGNKCDLEKEGIVRSQAHMREFCQTHKFTGWHETSAKNNTNVGQSILWLVNEMLNKVDNDPNERIPRTTSGTIELGNKTSKNNDSNCCQS